VSTRISLWLVWAWLGALVLPVAAVRAAGETGSSGAAVPPKEAAVAAQAPAAAGDTEQSVSMFPIKGDKPLSIRSDELEAVEEEGRRRLLFTRNVNIEQGDLRVRSDRLEALYPPGGNQPDKLIANGHVLVSQLDKSMRCDVATYYQTEDRLVCSGNAELQQGTDRVRGREIEIFVKQNRVKVKGGAIVNVAGDSGSSKAPGSKAKP
jgi:lipopolysaccharide export system protein LptA